MKICRWIFLETRCRNSQQHRPDWSHVGANAAVEGPGSKMLCRTAPGIGLVFQLNFVIESFNFGIVHAVSFYLAFYLLDIDSFNKTGRDLLDRLVHPGL